MNRLELNIYGFVVLFLCLTLTVSLPEAAAQRVRLSRGDRNLVISKLGQLQNLITVHLYTGEGNISKTRQTTALMEFMDESSDNITVVHHDMNKEVSTKVDLGVDHGPVIALKGEKFQGHSYYGLPSQLELEPFMDGILIAAGQGEILSAQTARFLSDLEREVHLRVFVTPD